VLASLIKSAATKAQIVISTQSVTLINHFKAENIIVVDRENNQSVFRRLNKEELSEAGQTSSFPWC
jgi:predicted ATPase